MNSNVNVMIYPYKKDYSELVYYYTEVLNQTIVLISGCFYEEMGPNINMFQNFSQGLENSETVIFTYSSLEEIDYNNIESAVCGKKKIIVSNKIYNFLPTSLSRYVSKTFGYNLSNYKEDPFANLFRMNIPIIGISGMGSNAEKTLTQIELSRFFESCGYKVCNIASKEYASLIGMNPLPSYLFENQNSVEEKVIGLNRYIYSICQHENYDVIVITVPGGIIPLNPFSYGDIGVMNFIFSNALRFDINILNIYAQNTNKKFINEIKKICMWKYAYTMPRIIMTHTGYYINSDDKKEIYIKESESQIENLYEEIQGENRLTKFYKNSRKDIQKMGRSIIRELQENLG